MAHTDSTSSPRSSSPDSCSPHGLSAHRAARWAFSFLRKSLPHELELHMKNAAVATRSSLLDARIDELKKLMTGAAKHSPASAPSFTKPIPKMAKSRSRP